MTDQSDWVAGKPREINLPEIESRIMRGRRGLKDVVAAMEDASAMAWTIAELRQEVAALRDRVKELEELLKFNQEVAP